MGGIGSGRYRDDIKNIRKKKEMELNKRIFSAREKSIIQITKESKKK